MGRAPPCGHMWRLRRWEDPRSHGGFREYRHPYEAERQTARRQDEAMADMFGDTRQHGLATDAAGPARRRIAMPSRAMHRTGSPLGRVEITKWKAAL